MLTSKRLIGATGMNAQSKTRKSINKAVQGFTLVEVLIVLGVFAVIASICYATLTQYLNVSEKLSARLDNLHNLQNTYNVLERDIRYVVNRQVRSESSGVEQPIILDNGRGIPGEFLRMTVSQPDYRFAGLGGVSRVAWYEDDGEIYRTIWFAVDIDDSTESVTVKLLTGVDSIELEEFTWSEDFGLQIQNSPGSGMPHGIRIIFRLQDGSEFARVFDIGLDAES